MVDLQVEFLFSLLLVKLKFMLFFFDGFLILSNSILKMFSLFSLKLFCKPQLIFIALPSTTHVLFNERVHFYFVRVMIGSRLIEKHHSIAAW